MFSPRLQEVWSREQPLLSPSPSPAVAAAAVVAAVAAAAALAACFDGLVPLVLPFLVELLLLSKSFFIIKGKNCLTRQVLSIRIERKRPF
jgi:hypothetical protein